MNEIVVGVDLSRSTYAAITWAADQARATGRTFRAVNAVDVSPDFNLELGTGCDCADRGSRDGYSLPTDRPHHEATSDL
jgi:hypothetical protein